jgi:hypothetical protein
MDRFFNSVSDLLSLIPLMAEEEYRGFRKSLYWLTGMIYFLFIFHLASDSYVTSTVVGVIISLVSVPVIWNVRRIRNMAGAGEILEVAHITPPGHDPQGAAAIVVNPLNSLFWNVSLQVFFFVIVAGFAVPLLSLRSNPLFVIIFPSLAMGIALAFKGTALRVVNWLSSVFILILTLAHLLFAFPQLQAKIGADWVTSFFPATSVAKSILAAEELQRQQRIEAINKDIAKIRAWQEANPAKELPEEGKRFMAQARQGGLKTFDEVVADIEKEKEREEARRVIAWARKYKEGMGIGNEIYGEGRDQGNPGIPAGNYCQSPAGLTTYFLAGDEAASFIGSKDIVIPPGRRAMAIRTDHDKVEIRRGSCKDLGM